MNAVFEVWTSRGAGGIAVAALRGPDRDALALALLRTPSGAPFLLRADAVPRLARLYVDGEALDEVLVVALEDRVELHLHGSEAVVAALERAVDRCVRPALAGPAATLAMHAMSEGQLAFALEQEGFDWGAFLRETAALGVGARRRALSAARQRANVARALCAPMPVVLRGSRNAGKSTLFNRLLASERALAGPTLGLTRDPVRDLTALDGYPYLLVDTAGLGAAEDELERRAQELGTAATQGAACLWVVDGAVAPPPQDRPPPSAMLVVRTKTDLGSVAWPLGWRAPDLAVAAAQPSASVAIRRAVGAALRRRRALPPAGPVGGPAPLTEQQHRDLSALGAAL